MSEANDNINIMLIDSNMKLLDESLASRTIWMAVFISISSASETLQWVGFIFTSINKL
jgi:hypothetical protein